MAGRNILGNLGKLDASYMLDPSVAQVVEKAETATSQEDIRAIEIDKLIPFRNHPFSVNTETDRFQELLDSVREFGVIQPILIRQSGIEGKYEIVAGHCRVEASRLCGLKEIPAKILTLDDFMATAIMTHTNIYGRDEILISEKAKAYRMCLDEEKKTGKNRTDTAATIGAGKDSKRQVQRFVRLSYLSDEFLSLIDNRKLTVQIGIELAFLDEGSQEALYKYIDEFHHIPNLDQAKRLRSVCAAEGGSLTYERVISLLVEPPKPKVSNKVSFKTKELADYFDEGTSAEEMSDVIKMLLAKYRAGEFNSLLGAKIETINKRAEGSE